MSMRSKILNHLSLLIFFLFWIAYTTTLLTYSASISHDDTLFFLHGIERYSVLEFSPHFPGYPGFIWLGKLSHFFIHDTLQALISVSLICALLIPWAIFYLSCQIFNQSYLVSSLLAAVIMLQPVFPFFALSGMSDSSGLLFLILGFIFYYKNYTRLSGLILGFSALCRPYLLPLIILFYLSAFFSDQRNRPTLIQSCLFFLTMGCCGLFYIFSHDGLAYINEGIRFISGHFSIWSANQSHNNWFITLDQQFYSWVLAAALFIYIVVAVMISKQKNIIVLIVFILSILLMLTTQNPDNARHIMSVNVLALICIATTNKVNQKYSFLYKQQTLSLVLLLLMFISASRLMTLSNNIDLSPADQAIQYFQKEKYEQIILSNHGIYHLKEMLPHQRILDTYHKQQWQHLLNQQDYWQLTSQELAPPSILVKEFPARFSGESKLLLYFIYHQ